MTWIKTIPTDEDENVRRAVEAQRSLFPVEYATPVHPSEEGAAQIVASHSLIPEALYHAFATFGSLMSQPLKTLATTYKPCQGACRAPSAKWFSVNTPFVTSHQISLMMTVANLKLTGDTNANKAQGPADLRQALSVSIFGTVNRLGPARRVLGTKAG